MVAILLIGFGLGIPSTLTSKVTSTLVPPPTFGNVNPILGSTPDIDAPLTVTLPGINNKPFETISLKNTLVKGLLQVLSSLTVYVTISPTLSMFFSIIFFFSFYNIKFI